MVCSYHAGYRHLLVLQVGHGLLHQHRQHAHALCSIDVPQNLLRAMGLLSWIFWWEAGPAGTRSITNEDKEFENIVLNAGFVRSLRYAQGSYL